MIQPVKLGLKNMTVWNVYKNISLKIKFIIEKHCSNYTEISNSQTLMILNLVGIFSQKIVCQLLSFLINGSKQYASSYYAKILQVLRDSQWIWTQLLTSIEPGSSPKQESDILRIVEEWKKSVLARGP